MEFKVFNSAQPFMHYLAEELRIYSQGDAVTNIALSGGSTPQQLFAYLARPEQAEQINWQSLHFWWGDERYVSQQDAASNYGTAKRLLFDHVAIPCVNLHPIMTDNIPDDFPEKSPEQTLTAFAEALQTLPQNKQGRPVFDWVLLGVGEDGHTASLFPGHTDYHSQANCELAQHPQSGQTRITLSAPLIASAKRVSYLMLGPAKSTIAADFYAAEQAKAGGEFVADRPAFRVRSIHGNNQCYLDREAAAQLPPLPFEYQESTT